jgi:hypothetical protein
MGNNWYRVSEYLQRDNLVLYNELNKYYDYENNKYTFIVQLYNNGGILLFNDKEVMEVIELEINIYNNNKTQAFINIYDAFYFQTGVDRYNSKELSYNLIQNMNWFVNFSMENKVICISDITHKFLDFLLKHIPNTLSLFKLLCYLKNIDQNKYI